MTDNEIIKALECCRNGLCTDCPRLNTPAHILLCKEQLMCEALDLINRQKAEIEALIAGQETLQKYRDEEINHLEIELKAMRGAANSYKAEIERLQNESTGKCELAMSMRSDHSIDVDCNYCVEQAKAEAVKEFAERLKENAVFDTSPILRIPYYHISVDGIDNLVKEMVGGG